MQRSANNYYKNYIMILLFPLLWGLGCTQGNFRDSVAESPNEASGTHTELTEVQQNEDKLEAPSTCESEVMAENPLCQFVMISFDTDGEKMQAFYDTKGRKLRSERSQTGNEVPYLVVEYQYEVTESHWPNEDLPEIMSLTRIDHDKDGSYDELQYRYQQNDLDGRPLKESNISLFQGFLSSYPKKEESVNYLYNSAAPNEVRIHRKRWERGVDYIKMTDSSLTLQVHNQAGQVLSQTKKSRYWQQDTSSVYRFQETHNQYNGSGHFIGNQGKNYECGSNANCPVGSALPKLTRSTHTLDENHFVIAKKFEKQDFPTDPWTLKLECDVSNDPHGNALEETCVDPNNPVNETTTHYAWKRAWEAAGLSGPQSAQ